MAAVHHAAKVGIEIAIPLGRRGLPKQWRMAHRRFRPGIARVVDEDGNGAERGPRLLEGFRYGGVIADVSLYRHGANAQGFDLGCDCFGPLQEEIIDSDTTCIVARQHERDTTPGTLAGAR